MHPSGATASGRPWALREVDEALALAISQRHDLHELVGRVLAGRGVGLDQVASFIEPRLRDWLPDPSHLHDLDRAAARIARAIGAGERIGILGDYDVDGATSAALLVRYLRGHGIAAEVLIPDRLGEGYGASEAAFDQLAAAGCRLCLTLDNGTTAFAPIAHATGLGLDVIVVDHHAAEGELPCALAVVNPNRQDQESPLKTLAAVGVTFVLLVAVNRALRAAHGAAAVAPDPLAWLDLVALGTVCDVVPLTGLNRAFVRQGLKVAGRSSLPGLAALATCAGIERLDNPRQLGFALGPRLNAASRLGQPALATRLLTTDDAAMAQTLAARLDTLNRERQGIERELLAAAETSLRPQLDAGRRVLVAAGAGWHFGVVGIVASRLVERFGRPVVVVALDAGRGRGSARSVAGFDMGAAVIAARQAGLLARGGGHAMAAGMTLEAAGLERFAAFLEDRAGALADPLAQRRPLEVDAAVTVAGVTPELALKLERIAPFGPGNSEPCIRVTDARVIEAKEVGDGHVSCWIAGPTGARVKAIAFRARGTPLARALDPGAPVELAGRIKADRWQGTLRASLELEDATLG